MASASEKKILVVDDEPDVRNFLATCIEDAGFQVRTAVDGADAWEKIREEVPDLMTLDMVMPRKSGIQLMRELKKHEEWRTIPVIVITAHAKDELGDKDIKEFKAFATRYRPRYTLEKPVTPENLVKSICDILEVDTEEGEAMIKRSSEKDKVKNLINNCDTETLKQIQELLNKS